MAKYNYDLNFRMCVQVNLCVCVRAIALSRYEVQMAHMLCVHVCVQFICKLPVGPKEGAQGPL